MTVNNIYFTCNGKRVTIGSTNVKYTFKNNFPIEPLAIPDLSTYLTKTTKITNLLKIIERLTITGNISTGLNNQVSTPVERTNAADVLADLIEMAKRREIITMVWAGNSYTVAIEGIDVDEVPMDITTEAPSGVKRYDVTINVVYGELMF